MIWRLGDSAVILHLRLFLRGFAESPQNHRQNQQHNQQHDQQQGSAARISSKDQQQRSGQQQLQQLQQHNQQHDKPPQPRCPLAGTHKGTQKISCVFFQKT